MRLARGAPLSFIFLISNALAAPPAPTVPGPVPGGLESAANLRLFVRQDRLSYYAELATAAQTDNRQFRAVTLGLYYRLLDGLKIGAFYRRAYGLRHDEDWTESSGQWAWEDSNRRGENFLILDVTPRAALDFIPGGHWVGELKSRLLHDTFDHEQTLQLRPGLTYFWLADDQPFLDFFLQLELDFALNYGIQTLPEKWLYLGALAHASPRFELGLYGALSWQAWGSTAGFVGAGGAPYAVTAQAFTLGIVGILEFDP